MRGNLTAHDILTDLQDLFVAESGWTEDSEWGDGYVKLLDRHPGRLATRLERLAEELT